MKCIDLFAGCGGLSLGMTNAGLNILAAFEKWDRAVSVYKANFEHPVYELDLAHDATHRQIVDMEADMIMGGPPCQDFSSAGKRDVTRGRADMTYHFASIVCKSSPEWFLMENVEQIKKSHILSDVIEQFKDHGYGLSAFILDASYCGVPQARTRFFLAGRKQGKHNELLPYIQSSLSKKRLSMKDYFGDELNLQHYYRHPRNYDRRAVFTLDEPSPTIRGVNRPVPPGYRLNSCDPVDVDMDTLRPLTTLERSRVQTFPPSFKFKGTKTDLEQMIGNAVPVNLAEFVGKAIMKCQKDVNAGSSPSNGDETEFMLPERVLKPLKD